MELFSVTMKHFHPPVMLPPFLLKSHHNSIIPLVTVLSVNIAQVFPDHNCKCILCLPPPNASLIVCVNIINVYSPGTVCYLNLNVHTFVLTGRLIMCLWLVCMSVNWTPGDTSVWLFQLPNRRTGFDEIYLSVECEGLMVVTEDLWYMILYNLVKINDCSTLRMDAACSSEMSLNVLSVRNLDPWSFGHCIDSKRLDPIPHCWGVIYQRTEALWSHCFSCFVDKCGQNSGTNCWHSCPCIFADTLSWHAITVHALHSHFTCVPVPYFSV